MNKEILLTFCPSTIETNRICGHTFEVMDYYLFLKDSGFTNVKILIQEKISREELFKAYSDKYILPDNYKKDIIFKRNLKYLISKGTIIFTGGIDHNYNVKLISQKLLLFRCNKEIDYSNFKHKNVYLLQDNRFYDKPKNIKIINYIKKIYFTRYKKINKSDNKTLVYINSNIRKTSLVFNDDYLVVSGTDIKDKTYLKAPVANLFSKFNKYLYTETTRKFDCSSRLVPECYFYNKEILFNFNKEEYFKIDKGLKYRYEDTVNNFSNLDLKNGDTICNIITKK